MIVQAVITSGAGASHTVCAFLAEAFSDGELDGRDQMRIAPRDYRPTQVDTRSADKCWREQPTNDDSTAFGCCLCRLRWMLAKRSPVYF